MAGSGPLGTCGPVRAAVGGLVETDLSLPGSDDGIEGVRIAGRDRDIGLERLRQPFGELGPGGAAVAGFENAHAGAAESLAFDEALLLLPERGVDDVRVAGIEAHFIGARVVVLEQHLLEGAPAVGRAEDAALRDWGRRDGRDGDEEPIRGCPDRRRCGDHLAVFQAQMRPRLAGVGGFVDAVADREIGTDDARAACRRR